MRSEFYRFTEFRTSLCVSQFAASFIDTRAKASTAARDSLIDGNMTDNREAAETESDGQTNGATNGSSSKTLANGKWTYDSCE